MLSLQQIGRVRGVVSVVGVSWFFSMGFPCWAVEEESGGKPVSSNSVSVESAVLNGSQPIHDSAEDGGIYTSKTIHSQESLEAKWGIQVKSVRVSAGGYMIDFRYKVFDAKKAKPIASREHKPYLIDQASKAKLLVPTAPKIGSLRQTAVNLMPGRIYGAMFCNPAHVVKAGSKVTVVIGDCRIENLTVE